MRHQGLYFPEQIKKKAHARRFDRSIHRADLAVQAEECSGYVASTRVVEGEARHLHIESPPPDVIAKYRKELLEGTTRYV